MGFCIVLDREVIYILIYILKSIFLVIILRIYSGWEGSGNWERRGVEVWLL